MRILWIASLVLALATPVWGDAMPPQSAVVSTAKQAIARKDHRHAIVLLSGLVPAAAPQTLLLLGQTTEAYVETINERYRRRKRLDPKNAEWLRFLRAEQRWAAQHHAHFAYYEPGGRYRYLGTAYKLFLERYAKHPLAHEAAWKLIPCEAIAPNEWDPDQGLALQDAKRYADFLSAYPQSRYRHAAKVAMGWDYLYASGLMWGHVTNRRHLSKGRQLLTEVIQEAPGSPEAMQARKLLARHLPQ